MNTEHFYERLDEFDMPDFRRTEQSLVTLQRIDVINYSVYNMAVLPAAETKCVEVEGCWVELS